MRVEPSTRWPHVPRWALLIVGGFLALVGLHWLFVGTDGPPLCYVHRLTGYPCPACGLTRMTLAAIRGDFGGAFWYNPLGFLVAVGVAASLLLRMAFRRRIVWITSSGSRRLVVLLLVTGVLLNWAYLLAARV